MEIEQIFSNLLPKGKYFIGDLSYILPDDIYEEYVVSSLSDGAIVKIVTDEGEEYLSCFGFTFDGDGLFKDKAENEYSVDTGIIGIVQLYNEDIASEARRLMEEGLAQIVEFEEEFGVSAETGVFNFGHVVIDTTVSDEEESWDEEDENEEEDDENWNWIN